MTKKELLNKISSLQDTIDEQKKVLNFLCEHDRKEVYIDWNYSGYGCADYFAKFLYDREIKEAKILSTSILCGYSFEIVNNQEDSFVVCVKTNENKIIRYFKVQKSTCRAIEITEFFENKENNG